MTIRQIEKLFTDQLTAMYGFEEARNLAWLTVSYVCRFNRMQYLGAKEDELSFDHKTSILQVLEELKTGRPLQYVLGETEFYGLIFKVNPFVLIPRPETEELVDWIIKEVRKEGADLKSKPFNILDIGTGSGCIAISLKKNLPDAIVTGLDISSEAIETAISNSILNNTQVLFIKEDILNPFRPEILNTKFNRIVSNPPYVTQAEKGQMHRNVLAFEPHTALFVQDEDPLVFYKAIALFAKEHLTENGRLFLEINENLGEQTVYLLREFGYVDIRLRTDLRGRHRMINAARPGAAA